MANAIDVELKERLAAVARAHDLRLLLLFGSRARGDVTPHSDWDFAFLAATPVDSFRLSADLEDTVTSEHVDVVDLDRAGGLIRLKIAQDGIVVHEREPETFDDFRYAAALFWCDAGSVIEGYYDQALKDLGP